jgi:type I restriction enzyme S subunit
MMSGSEWQEAPLGQHIKVQGGYAFKSSDFSNIGMPVIKIKNVRHRYVDVSEADCVDTAIASYAQEYLLNDGDVVISMTGSGPNAPNSVVGRVARYVGMSRRYLINQRVGRLIAKNTSKIDMRFLFLLLTQSEVQNHLVSNSTGSANQANISNAQIEQLRFVFPPIQEQRAIATVLGALDDKIDLNRRMNETLEAMARAIFKDWFVDFGPVRAKAEGRPPYLAPELWSLFPDALDDEDKPVGWPLKEWGLLATLEYGKRLEGYQNFDGIVPVYGTNGQVGYHHTPLCNEQGVIIGRKGAYRGVHFSTLPFFVIDTAFYLKPKVPLSRRWAYYIILAFDINSMDSGSAIPSTSREDFYSLPVIEPSYSIQIAFDRLLGQNWARQTANDAETHTLTQLRDLLLPKLMSGEIRLRDAEKAVENAI